MADAQSCPLRHWCLGSAAPVTAQGVPDRSGRPTSRPSKLVAAAWVMASCWPLRNPGQLHHHRQGHGAVRAEAGRINADEINKAAGLGAAHRDG